MRIQDRELEYKRPRLPVVCANGLRLSIQAGRGMYSSPYEENRGPYTAVEIGYPSREIPALLPYAEEPSVPTWHSILQGSSLSCAGDTEEEWRCNPR